MAVTVYDIARTAGVSRATVQRALLGKGRISPDTKARIQKIAEQMHYRPDHNALRLTLGRSNLIGIVMFPTIFTQAQMVFEPIAHHLHERDYHMLFTTATGSLEDERLCFDQLFGNRVVGAILISGPSAAHQDLCQELVDSGVKVLLVDSVLEGLEVPQLIPDQYGTGKIITEYVISYGHRNIVHLAMPEDSYAGRERRRGVRDALEAAGIPVTPETFIETAFSEQAGGQALRELLRRPDPPTAVIARHDLVAMGAIEAALAEGLSVPEDISFTGAAGMWFAHLLKVPLTTVDHMPAPMAEKAVRMLVAMLNGEDVKPGIDNSEVKLIERASVAPPNPEGLRRHLGR